MELGLLKVVTDLMHMIWVAYVVYNIILLQLHVSAIVGTLEIYLYNLPYKQWFDNKIWQAIAAKFIILKSITLVIQNGNWKINW